MYLIAGGLSIPNHVGVLLILLVGSVLITLLDDDIELLAWDTIALGFIVWIILEIIYWIVLLCFVLDWDKTIETTNMLL